MWPHRGSPSYGTDPKAAKVILMVYMGLGGACGKVREPCVPRIPSYGFLPPSTDPQPNVLLAPRAGRAKRSLPGGNDQPS